jgi:adenosine deaminase
LSDRTGRNEPEARLLLEHPRFLEELPKTDLHLHLDGSLRLETLQDLAHLQGVTLPASGAAALRESLASGTRTGSLEKYLKAFDVTLSVLQEPEALRRVAREIVEDARRDGVRYVEVRFSPILHLQRGHTMHAILERVLLGLEEGSKATGVLSGTIVCGMRHIDPKESERLAELAVAYKSRGVVGFDLAGAEQDNPAKRHREAFYIIRNNNVNCTCHAGEGYGAASIHQAIHYCGAHRIGHGTRLREDADLMSYVNDRRIPMEICLSSNLQTGLVDRLEDHPFPFYYEQGLRVTLNSDNTLVSATTMTREYRLAVEAFRLGIADVRKIVLNGFKSTFLPFPKKVALLTKVLDEMDELIAVTFGPIHVPPRDHF